ncbi:hypothetical protein D3874_00035, partial [Oleomonas cavernae]
MSSEKTWSAQTAAAPASGQQTPGLEAILGSIAQQPADLLLHGARDLFAQLPDDLLVTFAALQMRCGSALAEAEVVALRAWQQRRAQAA